MKKSRTLGLQILLAFIPLLYLLFMWSTIPQTVPMHFNAQLEVDSYGSKWGLLAVTMMFFVISVISSVVFVYMNGLNTKHRNANQPGVLQRLSWGNALFLSLVSGLITYLTIHSV